MACASTERFTMEAYSLANTCWLPAVTMVLSVADAVAEPNKLPLKLLICVAPLPPTWY